MKIDVLMPEMGESVVEGTVAKWLKQPGDPIQRDETLLEITTDKVDTEVPAPKTGVVAEIVVPEGETAEVGAVLARIETDKATEAEQEEKTSTSRPKAEEHRAGAEAEEGARREERPGGRKLTPVARQIVEEEKLPAEEIREIPGTGRGERITKQDVLQYLDDRAKKDGEKDQPSRARASLQDESESERDVSRQRERVEIIPMSPMRKRISDHMVYSKRTSAHTYTVAEADMSRIVSFRQRVKDEFEKQEGFKLTYTAFILYAVVQTLKEWPLINSSVDGETIVRKKYINLGVAVALEEGLIVPVVKDADEKNLLGLARAVHDLGTRARRKQLKPDEVQDGTFTVTNPGTYGNIFGLPIINQPQVGILGVGAIQKRSVVIDDAIAIRSMMYLSFSYDHRVIDGAMAGNFLQDIVHALENYDLEQAL